MFNFDIKVQKTSINQRVYDKYIDDIMERYFWFTFIIAISEVVLMIMDFKCGFFDENPINILNLYTEIGLIFFSALLFPFFHLAVRKKLITGKRRLPLMYFYRAFIILAIFVFSYTDIYARHKAISTYIVFLFVLQITPDFIKWVNYVEFTAIASFVLWSYYKFIGPDFNVLFGTSIIFICFAVSTDFLRGYFRKQLINYYEAKDSNESFMRLSEQTIFALSSAVEAKDNYTKGHSLRVAEYSRRLAKRMGYSAEQCRSVYYIGILHDIGKIGVSDSVINKKEGLTNEEYAEMKKHPIIGYEILKQITEIKGISEGARWHHERYDGKGYPDGLAGKTIPEIARIIAVADTYDAMTSNRSYRKAMPQSVVREQIEMNLGTQFDPEIGKLMLDMIDEDTDYKMRQVINGDKI